MNTAELEKVRANHDTWLAAFNAKDIDTLVTLYDPESVYANAEFPLMRGVDQIKPWYAQAFANIQSTLHYKEETAFLEGTMAILSGVYYFEPLSGDTTQDDDHLTGRVLLAYRRNAAGEWKLLFDMDNRPPDVSPADFS
ncbi:nuclear transport factor 2 family protein [Tateyamaria sp. ANG-S1]|uniref:YybH family protein n=1 Tax=Tateyamaria sp. ANG-S1 TaxID=1577905 RepID=UPI00057F832A|nr:nuclear transport factor 2 family protein [Tateyamaria sp. ANG-S1]KIC49531.1 hypothetical protein RA29_07505 [Tateyamaria sp. ANG-S1]